METDEVIDVHNATKMLLTVWFVSGRMPTLPSQICELRPIITYQCDAVGGSCAATGTVVEMNELPAAHMLPDMQLVSGSPTCPLLLRVDLQDGSTSPIMTISLGFSSMLKRQMEFE